MLALFRDGKVVADPTEKGRAKIKLPDERHGVLFVFRVFSRMSYALILSVKEPVAARRPLHPAVRLAGAAARAGPPRSDAPAHPAAASRRAPTRLDMIDRDEFSAWLRLLETPGVGRDAARALLARFGSPEAVIAASTAARTGRRAGRRPRARWPQRRRDFEARLAAALAMADGGGDETRDVDRRSAIRAIRAALLESADPPLLLYVRGRIELLQRRRSRSSAAATRRRKASRTRAPSPRT